MLDAGYESMCWNATAWEDVDFGETVFREYFEEEAVAVARIAEMNPLLEEWLDPGDWILELERLPKENWSEYWKRFFHTKKVSDRIVIKPSWENYAAMSDEIIIELDPGMSFGTGQHPTTRTCLSILDSLSRDYSGSTFLDLGCGSGVLSIAAAKLGFTNVTAIDNDPLAIEIAKTNAAINGVDDKICFIVDDLIDTRISGTFNIVVINMLANLLREFADTAKCLMSPSAHSRLIVAGMLDTQYDETMIIYNNLKFNQLHRYNNEGWSSVLLSCTH